jgi:hypothetical protein
MTMLRDLLTLGNWSARDTLTRALDTAATDHDRDVLRGALHTCPVIDPLDAQRAGSGLVALLRG